MTRVISGTDSGMTGTLTPTGAQLRILATSDLHVHITPWDYYADRASATAGLARTATLIAQARAEVGASILLDNGDFLHGSPMGDLLARDGGHGHPMIAAMNALGYDAAALGNHEFSNGLPFLLAQLAQARFPVICANIAHRLGPTPSQDQTLVPPTTILTRDVRDSAGQTHALRIGLIGLLPPQTTQWDRQQLANALITRDILEAAAAHVPALRAEGADIVIALSHSGIGATHPTPNMEDATAALAALPGIDALVAGHTHQTFPSAQFAAGPGIDPERGLLWGKPAVMPGFHGSHLGVIDLTLDRSPTGWHVASAQVALRPIARRTRTGRILALTKSAPQVTTLAAPAHRATRRWAQQTIGHSAHALHSYFSLIAPCALVRLIARAQADHVATLLRGGPHADLPVLSAAAPFHSGGRGGPENYAAIPAGPLLMRHAFDLYPHPNTIAALLVTGAEVHLWLERSFSLFHQISPGSQDAELINPHFPSFNFDLIEGLTWAVDLTQPPRYDTRGAVVAPTARRIRNLCHGGRPIDPDARFVLATNSYRAAGSGGFAGAAPERVLFSGPDSSRAILLAHIAANAPLGAPAPPNWRFAPTPGTTAVFDSAPAAPAFLPTLGADVEPLDLTRQGFRRFRLRL
jgi:2',3'-cyclic-nucleotide 2'-phosphodiesterase/3'-nucleotidase